MPIKDLQQQQAQVGRIRLGHKVAGQKGERPEKLDRFRFTSPQRSLIDAVAGMYGGKVEPWDNDGKAEWQVTSTATALRVLIPPRPVTQWYELWSGAGCQRRCDGETETISGDACKCPLDAMERAELAGKGKACKATTRLKVMLPDVPGLGVWRLDSHGFYAAIELPSTAEFLGAVTDQGGYIRATLALEPRTVKRPGQGIRSFFVPALHVEMTPEQLIAGAGTAIAGTAARALQAGASAAAPPGPAAIAAGPDPAATSAQEFVARVEAARSAEELRALWQEAGPLLTVAVLVDGEHVALSDLMRRRGEAYAAAAVTLDERSVDDLWLQCMQVAADLPAGAVEDIEAAFTSWAEGRSAADATAEDTLGFLAHLTSLRDGVPA